MFDLLDVGRFILLHAPGYIATRQFATASANAISMGLVAQSYFSMSGLLRISVTHLLQQSGLAQSRLAMLLRIHYIFDSAASDEAPNPTPVRHVEITADQGQVQASVSPAFGPFPAHDNDTDVSMQTRTYPNNNNDFWLSRTSASWVRADPHLNNEKVAPGKNKCLQKGFAVTDQCKEFMLIQHTSIWLAGITFQFVIFGVAALTDFWFFWGQGCLLQFVAFVLRLSGTLLAIFQWSSFLSYSLASRGIFPFYMYFKTPQNTFLRAGDNNFEVGSRRRYRQRQFQEAESRGIIRYFSRKVPSLDSTFIFLARKVCLPPSIALTEADGETFYDTCRMHSCRKEDLQWVSHRWTFVRTNRVHFSRFGFPQETLLGLRVTWGTEAGYYSSICGATALAMARWFFLEAMKSSVAAKYWNVRLGLDLFAVVLALLFSFTPWGKQLVLCRKLDQDWQGVEQG